MARLSAEQMEIIKYFPVQFGTLINITSFKPLGFYTRFEDRAEELEQLHPGQGYQLSYNETLTNLFGGIVTKHLNGEADVTTPSLHRLIELYDTMIMKPYFETRKTAGLECNIRMGNDALDEDLTKTFKNILDQVPSGSVMDRVTKKFKDGELSLTSTYNYAKSIKDTTPGKQEALELVAYAKYLERKNEARPLFWMILCFPVHIIERNAIDAMKELAAKCAPVDSLLREAMDEKPMLEILREDVKDAVTLAEYKAGKPLFTEEIINDIGPVEKKEEENLLDQTLDIGGNLIDENGEIDSVSFEELLDNDVDFKDSEENNIIEDDFISEKVEFNNNEFDSFYNDAKSSKIEHSEIINDNQKVK